MVGLKSKNRLFGRLFLETFPKTLVRRLSVVFFLAATAEAATPFIRLITAVWYHWWPVDYTKCQMWNETQPTLPVCLLPHVFIKFIRSLIGY